MYPVRSFLRVLIRVPHYITQSIIKNVSWIELSYDTVFIGVVGVVVSIKIGQNCVDDGFYRR